MFHMSNCIGHSESLLLFVCEQVYSCVPLFPVAKSRDVPHNKLDSEVVPKVARMTVSGKKQTMGFDVPRYLTHICTQIHTAV